MNFKKNWKRFWTLSSAREGFTLVELIVVIAILAILAGVAVPAYSGYVKKANMQADITLISEIEHALTLAGYNGTFADGEGGYIILSVNGIDNAAEIADGSSLDTAMKATFGESYKETLKLKYDGWVLNSALLTSALNNIYAESITNSSYVNNSTIPELLDNVQTVTQAAAGLLGTVTKTEDDYISALKSALGDDYLESAAAAGVLTKNDDGTFSMPSGAYDSGTQKISNELQTQLSNLMVLSVADELDGMTSDEMMEIIYADDADPYSGEASVAAQMAVKYAFYKAVDLNTSDGSAHFDNLNSALASATGISDVSDAFDEYMANNSGNIGKYLYPEWDGISEDPGEMSEIFMTNLEALSGVMTGVNTVADNYNNAETLKDGNLYTSGSISNDVNGYVGAAAVAEDLDISDLPENGAVVYIVPGANGDFAIYRYMIG